MRKHKTLKIDDREITVKELRVKDIIELFGEAGESSDVMSKIEYFLPRFTDGITVEELKEMAPSEIKSIYDTFREVNEVFFVLALGMGLAGAIEEIKQSIRREFSGALAGSLSQGMLPPLNTDTPISSPPSRKKHTTSSIN